MLMEIAMRGGRPAGKNKHPFLQSALRILTVNIEIGGLGGIFRQTENFDQGGETNRSTWHRSAPKIKTGVYFCRGGPLYAPSVAFERAVRWETTPPKKCNCQSFHVGSSQGIPFHSLPAGGHPTPTQGLQDNYRTTCRTTTGQFIFNRKNSQWPFKK